MWQEIFQLVTHSGHPHKYSQPERKWQINVALSLTHVGQFLRVCKHEAAKLRQTCSDLKCAIITSLDTQLSLLQRKLVGVGVHATSSVKLMCPVFHYWATTLLNDNKIHWNINGLFYTKSIFWLFELLWKNFMQSVEKKLFLKISFPFYIRLHPLNVNGVK